MAPSMKTRIHTSAHPHIQEGDGMSQNIYPHQFPMGKLS
jgi:hypothetical protein